MEYKKSNNPVKSVCVCVCKHVLSYVWLCNHTDCSPPGSSIHGILPARILEWIVISSSRGYSWPRDQTHVSWVSCIVGRFFTEQPGRPLKKRLKIMRREVVGGVRMGNTCAPIADSCQHMAKVISLQLKWINKKRDQVYTPKLKRKCHESNS